MSSESGPVGGARRAPRRVLLGPGGSRFELGGRTRVMGIVNVTPDSFADGGRHADRAAAVAHGRALAEAGADVLDVGGESTRPGHVPVPAEEQIRRVVPVIAELAAAVGVPISIDTTAAAVAAAALDAGAAWVNDTSALAGDPELAALCAARGCPVVLMHRFDPPRRPGDAPPPGPGLARLVADRLAARADFAASRGIDRDRLVLDPGIGFGTIPDDNLAMHAFVEELRRPGLPLLFGPSRKSFLGRVTGRPVEERLAGTAAAVACLALAGVEIVRVHDVAAICDVVRVADAIRAIRESGR